MEYMAYKSHKDKRKQDILRSDFPTINYYPPKYEMISKNTKEIIKSTELKINLE